MAATDSPIYINLAVEDLLSEAVLRKVVAGSGRPFEVMNCFQHHGYGYLKKQAPAFNQASRNNPFLMLTDLDEGECPARLVTDWLQTARHPNFLFRVAVREVEAWLLGDCEGIAQFLGASTALVPRDPEQLRDPKNELIRIAKRSRRRSVREAIVPDPRTTAKQGPDYNGVLVTFVEQQWNIDAASERCESCESLRRALRRISEFSIKA